MNTSARTRLATQGSSLVALLALSACNASDAEVWAADAPEEQNKVLMEYWPQDMSSEEANAISEDKVYTHMVGEDGVDTVAERSLTNGERAAIHALTVEYAAWLETTDQPVSLEEYAEAKARELGYAEDLPEGVAQSSQGATHYVDCTDNNGELILALYRLQGYDHTRLYNGLNYTQCNHCYVTTSFQYYIDDSSASVDDFDSSITAVIHQWAVDAQPFTEWGGYRGPNTSTPDLPSEYTEWEKELIERLTT